MPYTELEKDAALVVIKRFGGTVSAACVAEVRQKLNKPVTPPTVRSWWYAYQTANTQPPKRKHRRVKPLDSNLGLSPENEQVQASQESLELSQESDDVTFVERIEDILDRLSARLATDDQLSLISGVALPKAIGQLVDQWLKLRHLDPTTLRLMPIVSGIMQNANLLGYDGEVMLEDMRRRLAERVTARKPQQEPALAEREVVNA
jgi:hypothetical protein